jgi:hypothetical protein
MKNLAFVFSILFFFPILNHAQDYPEVELPWELMKGMPSEARICGFVDGEYYFTSFDRIYKSDANFENFEIDTSFAERYLQIYMSTKEIEGGFLVFVLKVFPSETPINGQYLSSSNHLYHKTNDSPYYKEINLPDSISTQMNYLSSISSDIEGTISTQKEIIFNNFQMLYSCDKAKFKSEILIILIN